MSIFVLFLGMMLAGLFLDISILAVMLFQK